MWGRTATELAAGIRAREFSAREVMESHLERIAAVNPRVNAIVTLLEPELALRAGRRGGREPAARRRCTGCRSRSRTSRRRPGCARRTARRCSPSTCRTHDSLLVERLRARRRARDRQDEHAGVRRRLADVQRRLRRDPQPVRPDADARRVERRRGGRRRRRDAAVRRRLGPRRERPQPGRVLQPRRACARRRAGSRPPARAIRGTRSPSTGRSRARVDDAALLLSALAGPDPRDPLSMEEPFAPEPRSATRAGCGSPGAATSAGCRSSREVTAVLEARRATLEDARLRRRGRRAGLRRRRRVLRGAARRGVRGRVRGDRRPGQARAGREHPLRAVADAAADRARARAARRAVHAHARVPDALRRARRAGHAGRAVRRRDRVPARGRGRRDGLLPRVVPLLLADHGHRAPGGRGPGRLHAPTGCRSGCSSSAATAASWRCCGSRTRSRRRPGSRTGRPRSDALADDAPDRRAPRRLRRRRAAPVLAHDARESAARADAASPTPTCASSAAASPGCGRRSTPRPPTRRATSSCSRPRPRASAPAAATAASCVASLTHGIENGLARFADEMAVLERLALENFDALRADLERHGIDCDFEPTGELLALTDAYQEPWLEEEAEPLRRFGHEVDGARRRRRCAPRSPRPTYRGGVWDHTGAGDPRPGQARRRPARRGAAARRARPRALGGPRHAEAGDRRRPDRRRARARAARCCSPRAPTRRCCTAIRRYVVPVYDYVLVTEPLSRPRDDRLAAPPGHRRRRQPVPLLPPDRRRPDPVRRLGRGLPLRRPGRPAPRRARADVREARAALLPHVPAARGPALHPPLGRRDRHLGRFSVFFGTRLRRPAGLRHRLHRASASPPPASAAASRSTCSTAATPRPPACATCAPSPSRSRPSRCAGP